MEAGHSQCTTPTSVDLDEADIEKMLHLYDEFFFDGHVYQRIAGRITYRFSTRMTRTGGRVKYDRRKKTYELVLSRSLIMRPSSRKDTTISSMAYVSHPASRP